MNYKVTVYFLRLIGQPGKLKFLTAMKVTVCSPFLPPNIVVDVEGEKTIRDLFIEAQRISASEENLDKATKDFRKKWYRFFKDMMKGFHLWRLLEVKAVNGILNVRGNDAGNMPLQDMVSTLNALKVTWNLPVEVNSLKIDIGTVLLAHSN